MTTFTCVLQVFANIANKITKVDEVCYGFTGQKAFTHRVFKFLNALANKQFWKIYKRHENIVYCLY